MTHHILFFETTRGRRYLTKFIGGEPFYSWRESSAKKWRTLKGVLKAKRRAVRWTGWNHYDAHIHPEPYTIA
jgi:hypothetical protein